MLTEEGKSLEEYGIVEGAEVIVVMKKKPPRIVLPTLSEPKGNGENDQAIESLMGLTGKTREMCRICL